MIISFTPVALQTPRIITKESDFGLESSLLPSIKIFTFSKLSLSVYVANFPYHLTVRKLWNICGKMGTLVDVYIAKRKNHLVKMFAFCRYIKVSDSKTLIDSLSDVWIGKLRLHANVARFDRNGVSKLSHAGEKDSIDLQPKKPYLVGEKANNVMTWVLIIHHLLLL
nr:RNA-directed DNA polymerase, eukaryota [Tanacetum cinerariifolium]